MEISGKLVDQKAEESCGNVESRDDISEKRAEEEYQALHEREDYG